MKKPPADVEGQLSKTPLARGPRHRGKQPPCSAGWNSRLRVLVSNEVVADASELGEIFPEAIDAQHTA